MEMRDVRAVYAERKVRLVATLEELPNEHRAAVESLIADCDARLAGDVTKLADKREVRNRLNRVLAATIEDVLVAYGMRGHVEPSSAAWMDRKADIIRSLMDARKPTRSARRLVASAIIYDDRATVEVLTSAHSRVLLGALTVDMRAVQIAAVRALVELAGSLPGVAFILAQESEDALHELVTYASFLAPAF